MRFLVKQIALFTFLSNTNQYNIYNMKIETLVSSFEERLSCINTQTIGICEPALDAASVEVNGGY